MPLLFLRYHLFVLVKALSVRLTCIIADVLKSSSSLGEKWRRCCRRLDKHALQ